MRLRRQGRAAHSSFPELGESAIDKLLDALMVIRGLQLPDDPLLGRTHYTVGLIDGGVAPNVVSPHASAELLFRTVGDGEPDSRGAARGGRAGRRRARCSTSRPCGCTRCQGFETAVFPYTTDVPMLTGWGTPLLVGPGSIHVAHTDEEHIAVDELNAGGGSLRIAREAVARLADLRSAPYATLNVCRGRALPGVGEPHRGPDPVQLQPANRVRAGRQQR